MFTVEYDGDARTKPSTDKVSADVRFRMSGKAVRFVRKQGPVALYRAGGTARFVFTARPAYRQDRIMVILDVRVGGRWRTVGGTDDLRVPESGKVKIFTRGTAALVGKDLAVRPIFSSPRFGSQNKVGRRVLFRFIR